MLNKRYDHNQLAEYHDRIMATSMLLNDPIPVPCSCCGGARSNKSLFGWASCAQCCGSGYDILGSATAKVMGIYEDLEKRGYYQYGKQTG